MSGILHAAAIAKIIAKKEQDKNTGGSHGNTDKIAEQPLLYQDKVSAAAPRKGQESCPCAIL